MLRQTTPLYFGLPCKFQNNGRRDFEYPHGDVLPRSLLTLIRQYQVMKYHCRAASLPIACGIVCRASLAAAYHAFASAANICLFQIIKNHSRNIRYAKHNRGFHIVPAINCRFRPAPCHCNSRTRYCVGRLGAYFSLVKSQRCHNANWLTVNGFVYPFLCSAYRIFSKNLSQVWGSQAPRDELNSS